VRRFFWFCLIRGFTALNNHKTIISGGGGELKNASWRKCHRLSATHTRGQKLKVEEKALCAFLLAFLL
jgi:hypothetical protein